MKGKGEQIKPKKIKSLLLLNGRWGKFVHIYIAAKSIADACRICEQIKGRSWSGWRREINIYFSKCWGDPMDGIISQRGAWITKGYCDKPQRVI